MTCIQDSVSQDMPSTFLLVLNSYKILHFQLYLTINNPAGSLLRLMKYSMGTNETQPALWIPEQKENSSMATGNTSNPSLIPGNGCRNDQAEEYYFKS